MVDGILITVDQHKQVSIDTIVFDSNQSSIDQIYAMLDCDLVDCVVSNINGLNVLCWVDDEGILRNKIPVLIVPSVDCEYQHTLYGNVLITLVDHDGNRRPMNTNQANAIIATICGE